MRNCWIYWEKIIELGGVVVTASDSSGYIYDDEGFNKKKLEFLMELKNVKKGRIKAAFDVYWDEPYNGILKKFYPESFYMTPHIASTSNEFLLGCRESLDNLIAIIEEKNK